jgi:hypothetical protein
MGLFPQPHRVGDHQQYSILLLQASSPLPTKVNIVNGRTHCQYSPVTRSIRYYPTPKTSTSASDSKPTPPVGVVPRFKVGRTERPVKLQSRSVSARQPAARSIIRSTSLGHHDAEESLAALSAARRKRFTSNNALVKYPTPMRSVQRTKPAMMEICIVISHPHPQWNPARSCPTRPRR